ncbi:EamA family transporter [Sporosarcina sp. Marseille-Q4063]|uniref:DMT family transporter n=1 Tax=Sporosarcina sp. Marseille-Q4063 TaxID=2810514 RepID=UPI001BB02D08|nr:EamA family transporter [Sporosarcina sp. Marseille-Q4063]QUW21068.1 EamA family transporter [Sporosarcina sp. Marseille-Q4063]
MSRLKGIAMIIAGAMLWGATGPMIEWLLDNTEMTVSFMLVIRLLFAGAFLLTMLKMQGKQITLPWRFKFWARQLLIFGIVGMLGVQYTFVATINVSSAVIATLFQFLAPIYIILFVSWMHRKLPPVAQVAGMLVTLVGLFFLLTNGSLSGLTISKGTVLWGLVLGFTFSFYTLYPSRLMQEWGVLVSVGWAMLIGGIALLIMNPVTVVRQSYLLTDWRTALMLVLIIIVGTSAFILFLASMKYITAIETSILSSFEPLTAIVISMIWFGQVLGAWQLVGAVVMLIGVTQISIAGSKISNEADMPPDK